MTSDDFSLIENAFKQAIDLESPDLEAFLKQFRNDHPDLAEQLQNLLMADANSAETLSDAVSQSIQALSGDLVTPWIGREIGVWKITEPLGTGGMGSVFLAERTDQQFSQIVAIKILTSQLLDTNAAIRFRAERQILANLNHPNIGTLIDGGITETGLPYLVMEYVDGLRIDEYCDVNNLTIPERIGLFGDVCRAVDYAHRNLIVHCDLKPSNILVTRDGVLKLLDFGIAKLIEPESFEMTLALTAAGARVMTPEYASPEQVRGETVTVATDVYALGVLLFRLMTGRSPYGDAATTSHQVQSAILEMDPKRPSTVVSEVTRDMTADSPTSPNGLSRMRQTTVDRLRKQLAGDLDTIILKCLQKDPERRYQTSRELAEDLERFIRNEPINARGDNWRYKSGKFLKRNFKAVSAAALVVALGTSMVMFYTWRLEDERDKAQLAAAEANQVSDFLTNIFKNASPREDEGKPITARDLLDDATNKIERLEGQDNLKARLYFTIGESQFWLGEYDKAKDNYTQALDHQIILSPRPVEQIVDTYLGLADVEQVQGNYDASDAPLKSALNYATETFGENHKVTAYVLSRMAATEGGKFNSEAALDLYDRAQKSLDASGVRDDKIQLDIWGNSMIYHGRLGRVEKAADVGRQALELSEKVLGPLDPDTIIRTQNLSNTLRRLWRLEESLELSTLGVERATQVWPENHPQHRLSYRGHAINLEVLGRFDEAKLARERENELAVKAEGEGSSAHAATLLGLARWHQQRGYLEKAIPIYQTALEYSVANDGDLAFFTTLCRLFLAQTYNQLGDFAHSEPLLLKALENNRVLSASLNTTLDIQYGKMLLATGRNTEAIKIFDKLVQQKDRDGAASGPNIVYTFIDFASFYRDAGKLDPAENFARRAYEAGLDGLPSNNWVAAMAGSELAQTLAMQGEPREAIEIAKTVHPILLTTFGPDDLRTKTLEEVLQKLK